MNQPIDETGNRYGRLTVLRRCDSLGSTCHQRLRWQCRCDCGAEVQVQGERLRRGETRSCGCLHRDEIRARKLKHGHCCRSGETKEYRAWKSIQTRCYNPRYRKYDEYGGRGITVCQRWRDSFSDFLDDLGPAPSPNHSIDRIDNDGNYEPGNVQWSTQTEQVRNRRNTWLVVYEGKEVSGRDLCERLGLPVSRVRARLKRGWSVERAFDADDAATRRETKEARAAEAAGQGRLDLEA